MMYRSFVDLVFIVLCALIVVLEDSVELRGLTVDPAGLDSSASHAIAIDGPGVLVVGGEWYAAGGRRFDSVDAALASLGEQAKVVVVPADRSISHERVIAAWWRVSSSGCGAELGVLAHEE
jgi:biopolymer transport protein ExbD